MLSSQPKYVDLQSIGGTALNYLKIIYTLEEDPKLSLYNFSLYKIIFTKYVCVFRFV
ncbi:hypothetical protein SRABI04_02205 [Chryseobacterium sp. Bi04]|nr:hypothetical protein SRABI04_02205 [Chryseobacterium sp. Bi04]